jgi:hypothetical protein
MHAILCYALQIQFNLRGKTGKGRVKWFFLSFKIRKKHNNNNNNNIKIENISL